MIPVAIGAACGRGVVTPSETASTSEAEPTILTVYSGRNENLVGPLLEQFGKDTGIAIQVKFGGTAEIAATILEEGANSPADVFYAQDAGALGALQAENPPGCITGCNPQRRGATFSLPTGPMGRYVRPSSRGGVQHGKRNARRTCPRRSWTLSIQNGRDALAGRRPTARSRRSSLPCA